MSAAPTIIRNDRSPITFHLLLVALALGGLATSSYLTLAHFRNFSDIGYQSFCAISRSLNCDTVAQSPYSIFLNVPIATWGSLGYAVFIALLFVFFPKGKTYNGSSLLCLLGGLYSLTSIILGLISTFSIHSYCLMCLLSYGINFSLFLGSWMAKNRFTTGSFLTNVQHDIIFLFRNKRNISFLIVASSISLSIAGILYYPQYWHFTPHPQNSKIVHGITESGSPWIGAENPSLTIIEYADYLCFQCGKMHHHLRQLVNQYPDKIRLIHRHFPLDSKVNPIIKETIHPNSGLLSFFAIMAQEQNLFWQVNDALFREARFNQSINVSAIAKETGMDISRFQEKLKDQRLHQHLTEDIRSGIELNITVTPSYVVDGRMYSGTLPREIIEAALKQSK